VAISGREVSKRYPNFETFFPASLEFEMSRKFTARMIASLPCSSDGIHDNYQYFKSAAVTTLRTLSAGTEGEIMGTRHVPDT